MALSGRERGEIEHGDGAAVLIRHEAASPRQSDGIWPTARRNFADCFSGGDVDHSHVIAFDVGGIGSQPIGIDRDAERAFADCDRCQAVALDAMSMIETASLSRSAESSSRPSGVTARPEGDWPTGISAIDRELLRIDDDDLMGVPVGDVDFGTCGMRCNSKRRAAQRQTPRHRPRYRVDLDQFLAVRRRDVGLGSIGRESNAGRLAADFYFGDGLHRRKIDERKAVGRLVGGQSLATARCGSGAR